MIERTRKRPRKKSCSFKTLGWLIRREASWNVVATTFQLPPLGRARVHWCTQPTRWCDAQAHKLIRNDRGRRIYP